MDLVALTAQLKQYAGIFEGRVAGAAVYNDSMANELRPEDFPSAYVIPLGFDATANDTTTGGLYQVITERVGVVVEFSNVADRRGQGVTELYETAQGSIFGAILNWRQTDPDHALRGFEATGGGFLSLNRAKIFYQWEFLFERLITDADGWIVDAQMLRKITANDQPGAPPPPFSVSFPAPPATGE